MIDKELELYNPSTSENHKLGTIFSRGELKKFMFVNLFFVIFTVGLYSQYMQSPGCVQSSNSNQCWDLRPVLIFFGMIGTLTCFILTLFSLFRHWRVSKKE